MAIGERSVTLGWPQHRREELPNDAVIVQIGGTSPLELLATFGIETVEKTKSRSWALLQAASIPTRCSTIVAVAAT